MFDQFLRDYAPTVSIVVASMFGCQFGVKRDAMAIGPLVVIHF